MPAERCDPMGDFVQHLARREVDQATHEVEARATHACLMHGAQLGIGHITADGCHTAGPATRVQQRIDQRPVVGAVAGGLHDHVALEAQKVAQRKQLILRRVARRVLALGRKRKLRGGAEHMAVRIDRARRHTPARLGRIRMKDQPVGIHVHLLPSVSDAICARMRSACSRHGRPAFARSPNSDSSARSATQA